MYIFSTSFQSGLIDILRLPKVQFVFSMGILEGVKRQTSRAPYNGPKQQWPEIDILVSKLLGFETFANFLRVSVSVSENLVSEKKSLFQFRRIWSQIKGVSFGF